VPGTAIFQGAGRDVDERMSEKNSSVRTIGTRGGQRKGDRVLKPGRPALLQTLLQRISGRKVTVSFATPQPDRDDWFCLVSFHGVDIKPEAVYGVHPMQAMTLAIARAGQLVRGRSLIVLETGRPAVTAFPPVVPTWPGVPFVTRMKKILDREEADFLRARRVRRKKKTARPAVRSVRR
jgi:hypothetical protein